jgi:hypothetical protein
MKYCNLLFILFTIAPLCHIFLKSNLSKYEFLKVYKFYQILCFILKNDHNFKLYHNMLKFSNVISCIISYNFSLSNIYITSHLHVVKDSWTLNKP